MKKPLLAGLATLLMTIGLLVATAPTASAVCSSYAGCVDTQTKASGPKFVSKGRRASICGVVTAVASNATPRGNLRVTVTRNRGKFKATKVVPYDGGKMCVSTRKLKKIGGYTATVAFVPDNGSLFNPSSGAHGFDVAR